MEGPIYGLLLVVIYHVCEMMMPLFLLLYLIFLLFNILDKDFCKITIILSNFGIWSIFLFDAIYDNIEDFCDFAF